MIISKIEIVNFRGFRNKTIDFEKKQAVILSAANGIGKTTTIDAIEWCFTGDIGRLKTAFDTRSTNGVDRKLNTDGILKNREATKNDKVKVTVWLFDGKNEIVLCREQTKDELIPSSSTVTIAGDEKKAEDFIREYIGDSFYNFHFCDVQKSFNIQSAKRKDLTAFFGEFITNYDKQKQIADNLEVFADDVDRYINDKENQKILQDRIKDKEEQLENEKKLSKSVSYPEVLFYQGEETKISTLNIDEIKKQKELLVECGYNVAKASIYRLIQNENLKSQVSVLNNAIIYREEKNEKIERAIDLKLFKNNDIIISLETKYKNLHDLNFSKRTILKNEHLETILEKYGLKPLGFGKYKNEIEEKENGIKKLDNDIDLLSNNNKILKLLSSISSQKQIMIDYRNVGSYGNQIVRCPVCGSESFSSMEEELILKEAENYIDKNGDVVKKKEIEKLVLKSEVDKLYELMCKDIANTVEQEKEKTLKEINEFKDLQKEVKPYFDEIRKMCIFNNNTNMEETNLSELKEILISTQNRVLDKTIVDDLKNSYQKILKVLGYNFENETLGQMYEKINNLARKKLNIMNFSYDVFVSKINAISSILSNDKIADLTQKINSDKEKNRSLDKEIYELEILKAKATQRAKDIKSIVEKLSKDEYEKVGPALAKFYNKLARFNSAGGIKIVQEKEGISLVDNTGKNLVNILSNGQLSVFMLAHFFAGINVRNDREKLKVYFVDDLTACMDDVNMLAFMDLLKYQMTSKATIEQLFFVTCDERISKLLNYKLSGREIGICELLEKDFV